MDNKSSYSPIQYSEEDNLFVFEEINGNIKVEGEKRINSQKTQHKLINNNFRLVEITYYNNRTSFIGEKSDFISAGNELLVKAARDYNPSFGASFETYAIKRIKGAMLDEARSNDKLSRADRVLMRAINILTNKYGKLNITKLSAKLDIPKEKIKKALFESRYNLNYIDIIDIDVAVPDMNNIDDDSDIFCCNQTRSEIFKILTDKEKNIYSLYCDRSLNLDQIGTIYGVSESRVSQLMGKIKKKIKNNITLQLND